jgi:uncharacterized membrane protein YhhN
VGDVTTLAWVALVVAAVAAVTDWLAVGRDDRRLEHVAKPAVLVALVVVALSVDAAPGAPRAAVVLGLLFGLAGDVGLMLDRFVPGMVAFSVGHVAYLVAFVPQPHPVLPLVLSLVAGALLLALAGPPVVRGASAKSRTLGRVVVVYMLLLTAVVVAGAGTGVPVLVAGVALFAASDLSNGWRRFVGPNPGGRVLIHATYHVGQALLALSLLVLPG